MIEFALSIYSRIFSSQGKSGGCTATRSGGYGEGEATLTKKPAHPCAGLPCRRLGEDRLDTRQSLAALDWQSWEPLPPDTPMSGVSRPDTHDEGRAAPDPPLLWVAYQKNCF
jgi:hypothetical protein